MNDQQRNALNEAAWKAFVNVGGPFRHDHNDDFGRAAIVNAVDAVLEWQAGQQTPLKRDGEPSFYASTEDFPACTHRLSEKDIPVWVRNIDDASAVMDMLIGGFATDLKPGTEVRRTRLYEIGQWLQSLGWQAEASHVSNCARDLVELRAEIERLKTDKSHLIQQAQMWAQEARTQQHIVRDIGALVGCDNDWETHGAVKAEIERLRGDIKGPDEFETWKDAAINERLKRVSAEAEAKALKNGAERILESTGYSSTDTGGVWFKVRPITHLIHLKKGTTLYTHPPKAEVPEGWDDMAYKSMADAVEYWKNEATVAWTRLQEYIERDNPTHMGEPVLPKPEGPDHIPDATKMISSDGSHHD